MSSFQYEEQKSTPKNYKNNAVEKVKKMPSCCLVLMSEMSAIAFNIFNCFTACTDLTVPLCLTTLRTLL